MAPAKGNDKKVANGLVAVSFAAVLAVYSAGYSRTKAAATELEAKSAERRPAPRAVAPQVVEPEIPQVTTEPVVAAARETRPAPTSVAASINAAPTTQIVQDSAPVVVETPVQAPQAAPVAAVVAPTPVAPAAPPPPPPPPPPPKWKDGTYLGWGSSRHGDIQAQVVIEHGKILGATIAQCLTRYSCDVIDMLPPQVAQRQSADVDYVSRATESANAFYYAVTDALNKAAPNQ